MRLHNDMAMPLMRSPSNLSLAFKRLEEANAFHLSFSGVASGEALYNMACCLSLAVAAQLRLGYSSIAALPGLPPLSKAMPVPALIEARVDLAFDFLDRAIEAGYHNATHMRTDPDFSAAREAKPRKFEVAVARACGRSL